MPRENLMPLHTAVRKAIGWNGNSSTIYKWWRDGVSGVRLEADYVGRRLFTSVEAVERFRAAVRKKQAHGRKTNPESLTSEAK